MEKTIFEQVWQDPEAPFIVRDDRLGVGVVADVYPKFPDQIVIVPAKGFPERARASLHDLDLTTFFALSVLQRTMQKKMEAFSSVYDVRGIVRIDGYAVQNHPHIVMFPALRGESDCYTKPTRPQFASPEVRRRLAQQTVENLSLTPEELVELRQQLARL